jgi:hypothetical protein
MADEKVNGYNESTTNLDNFSIKFLKDCVDRGRDEFEILADLYISSHINYSIMAQNAYEHPYEYHKLSESIN